MNRSYWLLTLIIEAELNNNSKIERLAVRGGKKIPRKMWGGGGWVLGGNLLGESAQPIVYH